MGRMLDDYNARKNAEAHAAWREKIGDSPIMPKVSQMLFSKYISKSDLPMPLVVTIRGCTLDSGGNDRNEEPKWLLHFQEHRKAMRLSNTVLRYLEQALGDDSDRWIGQRVQLYVDPNVMMAGQLVGGVRLRVGKSAAAQRQAPPGFAPMQDPRNTQQAQSPWNPNPNPPHAPIGGPAFAPQQYQPPYNPQQGSPPGPQPTYQNPPQQQPQPFVDASTGEFHPNAPGSGVDPEFDDDIPF